MERTEAVGIILYRKDSVLLVKHTEYSKLPPGAYGFPAGRIENNETPIIAGMRELQEETGLITSPKYMNRQIPRESRIRMKEGYEEFIFHPFLCTFYEGRLRASRKTIPEWKDIDSLENLLLVSNDVIELSRKLHGRIRE